MIEIGKPPVFKSREDAAIHYRKELIEHSTKYERIFFTLLNELGYQFEFQKVIYTKKSFYIVDFYINSANLIVELDGEGHKERMKQDAERTEMLKQLGYPRVVRFWNKEILKTKYCKSILKTIVCKMEKTKVK